MTPLSASPPNEIFLFVFLVLADLVTMLEVHYPSTRSSGQRTVRSGMGHSAGLTLYFNLTSRLPAQSPNLL